MGWTKRHLILAITQVVMGSINTLSSSWGDNTKSVGSDGKLEYFNHPFFQAECMFVGELLCLAAFGCMVFYKRYKAAKQNAIEADKQDKNSEVGQEDAAGAQLQEKPPRYNPFVMFIPSMCEMIDMSLMYIGLVLTYPSSYQMLRGSIIIFTALMSVAFLGRSLRAFHWIGMITVIVGLVVTGLADFLNQDEGKDLNSVITGDLLIVIAQIVASIDMVLEEKFITAYDIHPLCAVGTEGVFGFIVLGILLIPMYYIHVPPQFSTCPENRLEDVIDAFAQIANNWQICLATIGLIISLAGANFAGVSVTKEISATTRTVLDSICTLVVWVVSIGVGWENFQYLQVVGYIVLVLGMFIYNDIIFVPFMRQKGWLTSVIWQPLDDESTSTETPSINSEINECNDIPLTGSIRGLENPAADNTTSYRISIIEPLEVVPEKSIYHQN